MSESEQSATQTAPAKINLFLHVTGKGSGEYAGYHLLNTLAVFAADMGDDVTIRPACGYSLTLDGPYAQALQQEDPDRNIVTRAARMMAGCYGKSLDMAIQVTKNIPMQAGLGGGSADAAATMRALAAFWGVPRLDSRILKMAPMLGADVPMCLHGPLPLYVSGIGENVRFAADIPALHMVLARPNFGLSTKEVFSANRIYDSAIKAYPSKAQDFMAWLEHETGNDLTPASISLNAGLDLVLQALGGQKGCLLSRMTGSGTTCFGIFEHGESAQSSAQELAKSRPDWWVRAVHTHPSPNGVL
ncbi:MAG: 4-(cytidine 5'-diphospho)-2-C-methyl-D-erythritol kinase [Alphaproteobacteria bacterium]|nr:MAG: 4-(cytidine 5'-diphospho)-2-C-methyl-D-erythritol kinase [Alphaproteobacteria bacterium]